MDIPDNYLKTLFPYAYNILGSADDAIDVIQDVMLKHVSHRKEDLENEKGYLIKSVVNQSINLKKRNRRAVGERVWLPEPVEMADSNIKKEEILSYSMLVLLEKLNPKERAVFILKEAFDYSHQEIADALSFYIENSLKLLSRAKSVLKESNGNLNRASNHPEEYLKNYIRTIKNGDIESLIELLSAEIIVKTDGGVKIKIVQELTVGISNTAELMLYVYRTYQQSLSVSYTEVNHQPALLFYDGKTLVNCQVFEIEDLKIKRIYSVVDPDKLNRLINF